jgi:hypothetical protein
MIDFDLEFYDNELSYMDNRLFCTFSTADTLESTLSDIQNRHTILYNKMFVLYSKNEDEFAITYNVDLGNVADFLPGAILVHRKKETKTLYTINALNLLIKELNNGVLNTKFQIKWEDYRNCILLTKGPELRRLNTQLYRIIEI